MTPSEWPPQQKMQFQLALRRRGVSDQAVLRAMEEVPRELFVAAGDRADAYRDVALPIDCGQTISQPSVVAYMTEQLQAKPFHRVLEIGTGSGYQAAVLSHLAGDVVTVERFRLLADRARERLATLECANVEVVLADGCSIPDELGHFDRILVTAALPEIPDALLGRLQPDGVLVAPVGPHSGPQVLVRLRKTADGVDRAELIEVRFVAALPGIAREM